MLNNVDVELIKKELTVDKFLQKTKNGSNDIYVITAKDSPNVMQEIGRLRELSFSAAGGGTGEEVDIDQDDLGENGYKQLIVWNPEDCEIVGGYRFIVSTSQNPEHLSTEHYFKFTDKFRENYLPYMVELGRSFVQPKYQSRNGGIRSLYALDNLWEGIGGIIKKYKHLKYLFGKVTMYKSYNVDARNTLLCFLDKYFKDDENLLTPLNLINSDHNNEKYTNIFSEDSYSADYKKLIKELKSYSETIPPLINAYMNLSPSMKVFGTVENPDFGNVEETGILITINDINKVKLDRYTGGNV
ncbi:MAG: GNAT family N-acetyltransferase [Rikenellaceae bacterium]